MLFLKPALYNSLCEASPKPRKDDKINTHTEKPLIYIRGFSHSYNHCFLNRAWGSWFNNCFFGC